MVYGFRLFVFSHPCVLGESLGLSKLKVTKKAEKNPPYLSFECLFFFLFFFLGSFS